MKKSTKSAFTLVEILIVVILLAVLAAIVIPQFLSSTDDAKVSATNTELKSVRDAIARYRAEVGKFPGYTIAGVAETDAGKTPSDLMALLGAKDTATGKGPWIQGSPKNAFDSSALVNGAGGWDYSASVANNTYLFNADLASVPATLTSRINNQ